MVVVAAAAAALVVAACTTDGSADDVGAAVSTTTTVASEAVDALDLTATAAPATLGPDVTFYEDVRCGEADRNVIDVALPDAEGARGDGRADMPLVIQLHGGGFVGGDKSSVWGPDEVAPMVELLDAGVAVASMNYRLLEDPDPDGVIKPLMDAARCLQFVRYHGGTTFGIDPDLIALRGGSAGAGTALWLALHDDLADADADDPILRQSTKPIAVAAHGTQATYDLMRWSTDVFGEYDDMFGERNLVELAELFGMSQRLLSFFGITDAALLESPEIVAYREDVDLLALMDPDDPPSWIDNTREEEVAPVSVGLLFHHSDHARALERQAVQVDYDATVTSGQGATPSITEVDYLLGAIDAASTADRG